MVRHDRHRILKTNPSADMSLAGGYTYSPCVSALSEEQIGVQAEKMEMSVLCGKEREEDAVETSADTADSSSVGCEQRTIPAGSSWESQEARSE